VASGSLDALRVAIDAGVNFIDTALGYGNGHSEKLVGEAVRTTADTVYVASKVPPGNGKWPARPGDAADELFSAAWISESTETSLRNLGLDTIDLQQLHTWTDEWVGQGEWAAAIEELKRAGKIRFFGVSIRNHDPASVLRLIESGLVDVVQVIYNVFDQSPEAELFPAALEHDIGIIARVPFDEGGLTGDIRPDTAFPEGDFREVYFGGDRRREVHEHVQAMARELGVGEDEIASVALRFCVSHPAVSTVIPGMRSSEHVRANVRAIESGPLDAAQRATIREHAWRRDFATHFYSDS
jgi:aryl-alcohol dehydrogenase-like predicted oxidoreductase